MIIKNINIITKKKTNTKTKFLKKYVKQKIYPPFETALKMLSFRPIHISYTLFEKWFCHMTSLQSILQNKYDMATEIDDIVSGKIWHG